MCLPVHLAACKKFLMIAGSTYTSRMWCILEIFVFLAAVNDPTRLECIPLSKAQDSIAGAEGLTEKEIADDEFLQMFRKFTVADCQCFSKDTRDKLLSIIEAGCGTLDDFDALIRAMQITFTTAEAVSPRSTLGGIARQASLRR